MTTRRQPTARLGEHVAEGVRDGSRPHVFEAKLTPPPTRRGFIPRRRLLRTLVRVRDERLVAVVAPPGYGKTTLLAQWTEREQRPIAWVTLDPADGDPVRMLRYVTVAIDRAVGVEPSVLALMETPSLSALSTVVPVLTSSLSQNVRPFILLLDDVHVLTGTPSVDVLAMLLEYLPATTLAVVAGRTDAGLPLWRQRVSGRLQELAAGDLAFDERETLRVVRSQHPGASTELASLVRGATEGWPAATYVVARSLQRGATAAVGGITATGGRELRDYLDGELVGRLDLETRGFLIRTAILDRMTGGLCDAVVGDSGSARRLRTLAAREQMVVPLDRDDEWYRYHPLLRQHLLGLLKEESIDSGVLHRRAARWLAAHGMHETAIDHLLTAGDGDGAAELISSVALRTYREGRSASFLGWVASLEGTVVRRNPYLAAVAGWVHILEGRGQAAEQMADLIDTAEYEGPRPDGAQGYEVARATLRALMARGGLATALRMADEAVAVEPSHGPWRPVCLATQGSLLAVAGEVERARSVLEEALVVAPAHNGERAYVTALTWLALLAMESGDWAAADGWIGDALSSVASFRHQAELAVAGVMSVAARVAAFQNELQRARGHLASFQVARTALSGTVPWMSVTYLLQASRAYIALSDMAGARTLMREAEDIVRRRPNLATLPAQVADLGVQIRDLPFGAGGASTLTLAEIRVLHLLPTFLTVPEIARRLRVAPNTVRTQIQAVYGKLGVSSRSQAVEQAVKSGLLEPLPIFPPDASPALDDAPGSVQGLESI